MDKRIERINQLAKKSREVGLTEEEKAEQQKLRAEYVAAFRGNLKKQLDNIDLVRPDGTVVPLKGKQS
ncbi:MAG: DUF896 domain-containing protein [Clostridia bacterium]|nr:DUF896 domain-containing protein [Clostridia bacterium]